MMAAVLVLILLRFHICSTYMSIIQFNNKASTFIYNIGTLCSQLQSFSSLGRFSENISSIGI